MRARALAPLLAAPLLALLVAGCASAAGGAGDAPRLVEAEPLPRVADLMQGRTVYFSRRLGGSRGDVVAFSFTPEELTSRGRLIGTLTYDGPRGGGVATGVAATLGFARTGDDGCGRLTLAFEETALDALGVRARFAPVAVDLARAGSAGRAAATVCEGARDLVTRLRDLGDAFDDLVPRH